MAEIPQNTKFWLFGMGPEMITKEALMAKMAGIVTLIVAIVSAATNNELGLGVGNWFLMSIALFFWGILMWFIAYFGAKEGYKR